MSQRLFNRSAELVVSKPTSGAFFGDGTNQITIRALRIGFDIEQTLTKEPNTSSIRVYNLAPDSAADLQSKPLRARLDVGYDGTLARIFDGDVRYVEPPRLDNDGATTVIELFLGDGDRAYRFARIQAALAPGATARTALQKVAAAMGFVVSPSILALPQLSKRYRTGLVLSGAASNEMTRIARACGLEWSIQSGILQVLPRGSHRAETAVVVSADSGMIGQPTFGGPPDKGKPPTLKVIKRIDPSRPIVPGGLIQVVSDSINGVFKVQRASLHGDTDEDAWDCEIEAVPKKP